MRRTKAVNSCGLDISPGFNGAMGVGVMSREGAACGFMGVDAGVTLSGRAEEGVMMVMLRNRRLQQGSFEGRRLSAITTVSETSCTRLADTAITGPRQCSQHQKVGEPHHHIRQLKRTPWTCTGWIDGVSDRVKARNCHYTPPTTFRP